MTQPDARARTAAVIVATCVVAVSLALAPAPQARAVDPTPDPSPSFSPGPGSSATWFSCPTGSGYLSSPTPSRTVAQGRSTTFTIDIHRSFCTAEIAFLGLGDMPPGMTTSFSPASTTGDSVALTVTTSNTWPSVTPLNGYGFQIYISTGANYPQSYLSLDLAVVPSVAPIVKTPASVPRLGSTLGSTTVSVRTNWSATDPDGIARYQVQRQVNGGTWTTQALATQASTSLSQSLAFGVTYRYRVRATDRSGHTSPFAYGRPFVPKLVQQTSSVLTSSWPWRTSYTSLASGGSLKYLTYAGADFSYRFTGAGVAWISVTGPTRTNGASVSVDGTVVTDSLNLSRTTTSYRRVVFARNFGTNGTHTLHVREAGTQGHNRMEIDAFVVLVQK